MNLLEKINNIDDDLIEEAGKETFVSAVEPNDASRKTPLLLRKKGLKIAVSALAAALVLTAGVVTFSLMIRGGNKSAAPAETNPFTTDQPAGSSGQHNSNGGKSDPTGNDSEASYGEVLPGAQGGAKLVVPMNYDEILRSCDLLLVGTCTKVDMVAVSSGDLSPQLYDKYYFSVDRVLGGQWTDSEFVLQMRHTEGRILWQTGSDQSLQIYKEGHQYLLPLTVGSYQGQHYVLGYSSLLLDLSFGDYRFAHGKPSIPEGQSLEDYSVRIFNDRNP